MSLSATQVAALTVGQSVVYEDPFGTIQEGLVEINDGKILQIICGSAAVTYALANCPDGIDSLSLGSPTQ